MDSIEIAVPAVTGTAEVTMFDVRGRRVRAATVPVAGGLAGISWKTVDRSGNTLPAGIYFLRVQAGRQAATRKRKFVVLR